MARQETSARRADAVRSHANDASTTGSFGLPNGGTGNLDGSISAKPVVSANSSISGSQYAVSQGERYSFNLLACRYVDGSPFETLDQIRHAGAPAKCR